MSNPIPAVDVAMSEPPCTWRIERMDGKVKITVPSGWSATYSLAEARTLSEAIDAVAGDAFHRLKQPAAVELEHIPAKWPTGDGIPVDAEERN